MIPELGHFALILALLICVGQSVLPMLGATRNSAVLMSTGRYLATGQFVFVALAFACLVYAFVVDDFSVKYVASHSNTLLPMQYKVSAVWGGHEGSLLLWMLTLSSWTYAVVIFSKQLPRDMLARVLAIMGMISVGFLLFILFTSNPFSRLLPNIPSEGADLNPLLQDFGLIVHPPMLYMGYVGFSVAFAFALAALLGGRLDSAWARWSRPWTIVAWAFLTLGIALGSWWAYYELGWGGWWFWDPVENASFMPWLVGTALMHSLAVTEKRSAFKGWTVLLAIIAFSLSLLGTFLVRSGVLTSVHAFASDPLRGQFVLALLGIAVVVSLIIYAWRAPDLQSASSHRLWSRETMLLSNNVVLVVAWVTVMLGTLYPLVLDFIGAGKLSIGPPYFNAVFSPLMAILALVLGMGVLSHWKDTPKDKVLRDVKILAIVSVALSLIVTVVSGMQLDIGTWFAVFLGSWIVVASVMDAYRRAAGKTGSFFSKVAFGRSYYAMQLGHLGFAMMIVGATVVTLHSVERDIRLAEGQSAELGDYTLTFDQAGKITGPNYRSDVVVVKIFKDSDLVTTLRPEKRVYFSQSNPMTEAGIDAGFFRDLYVALGEPLADGAWAMRLQYKPLVRWVWLGAILMSLGGALAVFDKRYRSLMSTSRSKVGSVDMQAGLNS